MTTAWSAHETFGAMLGSIVNLNAPDHYIHIGFVLISLANLLVIVAMVILFALALTVPFVHAHRQRSHSDPAHEEDIDGLSSASASASASAERLVSPHSTGDPPHSRTKAPGHSAGGSSAGQSGLWTARVRTFWLRNLPPDKMLPDSQPAYVASWIYVFGVLTMAALAVVIASGCVLALEGPIWWHTSAVGLFVNSLHLWVKVR